MRPKRNNQHSIIADYFIFSKYQRKAFIVLFGLCILVIFGPIAYLYFHPANKQAANNIVISTEKRLVARETQDEQREDHRALAALPASSTIAAGHLFYFDPNNASTEDWQKLGIRDKTIHTIQNYLAKGGKFRKAADIMKIYGMREADAERLMPYVRIEEANPQHNDYQAERTASTSFVKRENTAKIIEINSADTTAFISLPGIGSKLAGRIVNYRDKLGGFYSVEQVGETYGLPDSTFQKIKPRFTVNTALIRKIKLNTASAEELKTALIKYNVANAIVQYRQKNGPFSSLETLKNIPIIDDYLYEKIIHYLSLE